MAPKMIDAAVKHEELELLVPRGDDAAVSTTAVPCWQRAIGVGAWLFLFLVGVAWASHLERKLSLQEHKSCCPDSMEERTEMVASFRKELDGLRDETTQVIDDLKEQVRILTRETKAKLDSHQYRDGAVVETIESRLQTVESGQQEIQRQCEYVKQDVALQQNATSQALADLSMRLASIEVEQQGDDEKKKTPPGKDVRADLAASPPNTTLTPSQTQLEDLQRRLAAIQTEQIEMRTEFEAMENKLTFQQDDESQALVDLTSSVAAIEADQVEMREQFGALEKENANLDARFGSFETKHYEAGRLKLSNRPKCTFWNFERYCIGVGTTPYYHWVRFEQEFSSLPVVSVAFSKFHVGEYGIRSVDAMNLTTTGFTLQIDPDLWDAWFEWIATDYAVNQPKKEEALSWEDRYLNEGFDE